MTDENDTRRPEQDAARLGLVVVGEASALQSGDEEALNASEANIRDAVDELVDEPLTPRQEEVVARLAQAGGTLTAGLSGALAAQTGHPVEDVLEGAARSIVWQERLASEGLERQDGSRQEDGRQDAGHPDSGNPDPDRDGRSDRDQG
ncbi:hypothetical protein [Curtobacterium herbarum]|uniref:DUF222 domain-containing protein n=1 Tax=Curtobacterium herbarum TaxID=150122 RepID=A0ABP4K4B0_9MICO|nr:hypothetical protein [Curtobacterium herbarum]MBM7474273.1 hypothetical protein [Curtobacterium herbarum]MCS6546094.1 hypothetical protein [Curtobacterium herbarum]